MMIIATIKSVQACRVFHACMATFYGMIEIEICGRDEKSVCMAVQNIWEDKGLYRKFSGVISGEEIWGATLVLILSNMF